LSNAILQKVNKGSINLLYITESQGRLKVRAEDKKNKAIKSCSDGRSQDSNVFFFPSKKNERRGLNNVRQEKRKCHVFTAAKGRRVFHFFYQSTRHRHLEERKY
jgi:hypothetical protein